MPQSRIIVFVGLPGSGKSTWLAERSIIPISTDAIRGLLADDPTNQTIHHRVFTTARYLLRQRLAIRRPVTYMDATHLTRAERSPYLRIADWYGCEVEAMFFNTPLAECLRRNAVRERSVPAEAIQAMAKKLEVPELGEGFDRITAIRADCSCCPCA